VKLVLSPALVQGDEAPTSLIVAIDLIERYPALDVLIVGRGGGSAEDLMAFNDERVVRRLFALKVPVVSAVGHEVDFSLCDLVADVRAATPSEAAELVVADRAELQARLLSARRQLGRAALSRLHRAKSEVLALRAGLSDPRFILAERQQRLDELRLMLERAEKRLLARKRARPQLLLQRLSSRHPRAVIAEARARLAPINARLPAVLQKQIALRRARFSRATSQLDALSPLSVLGRGYAIVRDSEGGVVREALRVSPGAALSITVQRGTLSASVTEVRRDPKDNGGL
jgi:exodeoxyribonuclease VII large subunit